MGSFPRSPRNRPEHDCCRRARGRRHGRARRGHLRLVKRAPIGNQSGRCCRACPAWSGTTSSRRRAPGTAPVAPRRSTAQIAPLTGRFTGKAARPREISVGVDRRGAVVGCLDVRHARRRAAARRRRRRPRPGRGHRHGDPRRPRAGQPRHLRPVQRPVSPRCERRLRTSTRGCRLRSETCGPSSGPGSPAFARKLRVWKPGLSAGWSER